MYLSITSAEPGNNKTSFKVDMVIMKEEKIDVVIKLKREQRKNDEPLKLRTGLPALPAQNIICIPD